MLLLLLFFGLPAGRRPQPQGTEGNGVVTTPVAMPSAAQARAPEPLRTGLAGKRIVIDPGHGGKDAGATGLGPSLEKENVLAIALELGRLLDQAGAQVLFTRSDDTLPGGEVGTPSLRYRVEMANRWGAHAFVSIHNDWNPRPLSEGTTTYFNGPESLALAGALQRALIQTLGAYDQGLREAPFYVLRYTQMPAVLVEVGFLSNQKEARLLAQDGYRKRAALGIFEGLQAYFMPAGSGTGRP